MVISLWNLLEKIILIGSESLELYQRLQFLIFQKQRRRESCNIFRLQQQGTLCELSRELKIILRVGQSDFRVEVSSIYYSS